MATLTIEGVPPDLLARLARNAASNGRSLNSEAIISLLRHLRDGSASAQTRCRAGDACGQAPRYHGAREPLPACRASWGEP
jgi:hypothetical protein